jgi:hypothetical protein
MKIITINRNTQSLVNICVEGFVSVSSETSKRSFRRGIKSLFICIFSKFSAFISPKKENYSHFFQFQNNFFSISHQNKILESLSTNYYVSKN